MTAPGPRRTFMLLALLLIAGAVGGVAWWRAQPVTVASNELSLYGSIDIREVHLAFHDVEHLASVAVEEGDRVTAGQLLATQDASLLKAQEAVVVAEVDARRAALSKLQAGSRPEEIRKAQADVEAAAAVLRDANATARRIDRLVEAGAVDRQRADDTRAAAEAAKARLEAARAALDLWLAGPRKEDIAEAAALLARSQAELELMRERIDDTRLHAPCEGVVRERILQPGDIASPQRPVLVLALTEPVWVRAYAPEPVLGRLREGMPAVIRSDSYPDKSYRGWVGFISPTAEFTPRSVHTEALRTSLVYQVRVFAENPQGELRLGMPVTVRLSLTGNDSAAVASVAARCAGDT